MVEQESSISQVEKFHLLFDQPILDSPQIPSPQRCVLRADLISEELKELIDGVNNGDIVEIADALADIQFVLNGAVLEFGLKDCWTNLKNEVYRSNMSKACGSEEEAIATIDHYKGLDQDAYFLEKNGMFLVYRKSDNKVLKSINYSPADLGSIVNEKVVK